MSGVCWEVQFSHRRHRGHGMQFSTRRHQSMMPEAAANLLRPDRFFQGVQSNSII